jgi:hypothetical protein
MRSRQRNLVIKLLCQIQQAKLVKIREVFYSYKASSCLFEKGPFFGYKLGNDLSYLFLEVEQ